jgi:serine protease Do
MRAPTRTAVLAAALLLAACQPDLAATGAQGADAVRYSIFYNQGQHVEDLAKAGDAVAAAEVFAAHPQFFGPERRSRHSGALASVAAALRATLEPDLQASRAALAGFDGHVAPAQWEGVRAALAAADAALARHDAIKLLELPEYAAEGAAPLRAARKSLADRLAGAAPAALAASDPAAEPGFFAAYPVPVDAKATLSAALPALTPRLEAAPAPVLAAFAGRLRDAGAFDDDSLARVAALVAQAHMRASGAPPGSLRAAMAGVEGTRAAGLAPKALDGFKVGFVQATSQTLLREGQIEFPAEIDVDLPFEAKKVDLDRAFEAGDEPFLIVFDVALARTNRRVSGMESTISRREIGRRSEANPAFELARIELQSAQSDLQRVQMEASINRLNSAGAGIFGLISNLAGVAATAAARGEVEKAAERLRGTPQTVIVPVMGEYEFRRAQVDATRAMTVNYYVVDRRAGTYFKSAFDMAESQRFRVAYEVDDKDPDRERHLAGDNVEKDVVDWERAPMKLPLSRLVGHYLEQAGREQRLPSLAALREDLLRDKNTALARFETNRIQDSRTTDARLESVVQIFTGDRGSGSGFFVTPELVVTNQHVVGSRSIVEMKLSNGLETFGRVEATDARIDLALIRVQTRGKPVRLFSGQQLQLGAPVEIVGHPRGLAFSVTRGVVSAVREMRVAGAAAMGKPVRQVQYDAATSPGNSGGPVFQGDNVIGVVSWIRVDQGSQNLNFGIHYSEVLEWLREKNVQVVTAR